MSLMIIMLIRKLFIRDYRINNICSYQYFIIVTFLPEGHKKVCELLTDDAISHVTPVGRTQVIDQEGPTVVQDGGPPENTAVPLIEDGVGPTDRHPEGAVHGGQGLVVQVHPQGYYRPTGFVLQDKRRTHEVTNI